MSGTSQQACHPRLSLSLSPHGPPFYPVGSRSDPHLYVTKIHVITGVYRLWVCTGGELDDLGIASVHKEYNGGRDFWFERRHLNSRICEFEEAGLGLNLTFGAIPYDPDVSMKRGNPVAGSRHVVFVVRENFKDSKLQ